MHYLFVNKKKKRITGYEVWQCILKLHRTQSLQTLHNLDPHRSVCSLSNNMNLITSGTFGENLFFPRNVIYKVLFHFSTQFAFGRIVYQKNFTVHCSYWHTAF